MRLLLDTQSLIYYVDQDHFLSSQAHAAITDPLNDLLLSAATIWEIAIKVGIGKLKLSQPFKPWITKAITDLSLATLPISIDYADAQASLPLHHGDPFDRLLIAQALVERISIVGNDSQFDAYGVTRIW
jgi:PIN domain nuclease of toxin-antitoxin system